MTSQASIQPEHISTEVAVVGAGFGGLCAAIKLKEAGLPFVVLEKDQEVGGTWRDNTYPGCACDVQSHMYSYSFEGNPNWSKRYAPWNEIQDYILHTTEKYQLRPFIRFNEAVIEARFNNETGRWQLRTEAGTTVDCRFFILGTGPLHIPSIPDIPGLDTFKGKVFHSARWDHDYDLKGKKVVSIGTGGSAIQYVPEIAPDVEQLYVFQRSAAWVIPRDERKYTALEKQLFRRFPALRKLHRARLYWSNESRVWPIFNNNLAAYIQKLVELSIRLQVKDKQVAKKLTPDYTIGCKRILISNKYYPTFNRDNVELVTEGIREIREHSIVTQDGVERECDTIILGTGFVVDPRNYLEDFVFEGRADHKIQEDWKNGAESYYGVAVHGYPNFFQLVGPNSGLGHNSIIFMIECQVNLIMQAIRTAREKQVDCVEVTASAQKRFVDDVEKHLQGTVWTSGCQSWYQNAEGRNFTLWPRGTWQYWLQTRHLQEGDFEWYRLPAAASPIKPLAPRRRKKSAKTAAAKA